MARTRLRGITLAGVELAIEECGGARWRWPHVRHEALAHPPAEGACHIGIRIGDPHSPDPQAASFRSGRFRVQVGSDDSKSWMALFRGDRCERVASFDAEFSSGEVVIDRSVDPSLFPLLHPLDELIAMHRAVALGAIVLEGRHVVREGRAMILLGPDPPRGELAGARQWLAPDPSGFGPPKLFSTPWRPIEACAAGTSLPVDSLQSLHRAAAVCGRELRGEAGVAELCRYFADPLRHLGEDRLREAAASASRGTSVQRLDLPPETKVVPFTWGRRPVPLAFAAPSA